MWSIRLPQLLTFCLFALAIEVSAGLSPRLTPRSDPVTIPIFARDLSNGTTTSGNASNYSASGLTPLTISSDRQSYYAVIEAGLIHFRVALDTASSDLWLVSSACETSVCKAVPRYPLTYESATYVTLLNNATLFNASYADGTFVSGYIAGETIYLSDLAVANQSFGVVTNSNVTMVDQTSGILGLGFPRLSSFSSKTNSTPFFANLAQQGLLDYPLFALSLTRNATGSISLGAIDSSVVKNTSLINWHPITEFPPFKNESNSSSYLQWATPMSAFLVNGTQIIPSPTYANNTNNQSIALFDVGTAGIFGPFQDVSRIFALINGARLVDTGGQWAVPCDTIIPMGLTFGTHNYTLEPSDYIIGPASGNPNLCLSWPRALPPSSDGIDWQIGSAFLRTVYSIFSFGINGKEPPLIGLYPLHNTTNSTETPDFVSSMLSSESATIGTTLPNFLLPTPTFTTPAYAFNSSIAASVGGLLSSGLATSTYMPILGVGTSFNAKAIPTISPTPTLVTLVLTDSVGDVTTSISTASMAAVTLGVPPGWSAASSLKPSLMPALISVVTLCAAIYYCN